LGLIIAIWSAWSARKSRVIAQAALLHAQTVERRGLIKNLLRAIETFCAEMTHIRELIEDGERGISDLKHSGGSPGRAMITRAKNKEGELLPLNNHVQNLTAFDFRDTSEDELMEEITRVEGAGTQAKQLRESLQKELSSIEKDIEFMRGQH
jgi:hypothetical protein